MMPIRRTADSIPSIMPERWYPRCHAEHAEPRLVGALTGGPFPAYPTSAAAHSGRPFPCARHGSSPTPKERPMSRRLSGFQPTGHLHLGNLLGAIRPTVTGQAHHDSVILVVDLHAMTVEHDPARLRENTLEMATLLLAAGVDPARSLFYVQSHVPEHTELHYLLECATGYGEAHRMIQFKEKAAGQQHVRLSLLTYPRLMAADILLHGIEGVPVRADQAQHVELARDIAVRFNGRYGPSFVVPKVVNPGFTSRLKELSDPSTKMGKTTATGTGG